MHRNSRAKLDIYTLYPNHGQKAKGILCTSAMLFTTEKLLVDKIKPRVSLFQTAVWERKLLLYTGPAACHPQDLHRLAPWLGYCNRTGWRPAWSLRPRSSELESATPVPPCRSHQLVANSKIGGDKVSKVAASTMNPLSRCLHTQFSGSCSNLLLRTLSLFQDAPHP